ncbi:MAG: superoxide dismutase [Bacteroidales bacterium]
MRFELPDLPFELNALEPYISKKTLEFHYGKYHHSYIENLNKLISGTKFKDLDLETIIKVADGPIFNYAAQVWNHTFYFECLKPGNSNSIKASFADVIRSNFGSVSFFKTTFTEAVGSLFGVGWVWLVLNQKGSIEIIQKFNAGNPLRIGLIPLMTCDVWEHAYYLDYQNRLGDYADAFWKLINWDIIEKRYNDSVR